MGIIVFNGNSTATYGINIWSSPDYKIPERDQEVYHVPGRSGDLIVDYGSYKNVERTYTVSLGSDNASFPALARAIADWVSSATGYAVLQDSYEPDVYRMARFASSLDITNVLDRAALATITFDCKPQRFLLEGDANHQITVSNGGRIPNNTQNVANPRITVSGSGSGSIRVGDRTVSFTNLTSSGITVDCEMQECYTGTTSQNSNVTMTDGFPKVPPGGATLIYDGGITSVRVVLNTWIL